MLQIAKSKLSFLITSVFLFYFSWAQDVNIVYPVEEIEKKLTFETFEIFRFRDLRFEGDIGKRVILKYEDGKDLQIKWRRALNEGHTFNNAPRFEIAAYELQKLFLDESDFVVPPTIARGYLLPEYLSIEKEAVPTFKKSNVVLVMMQYWLNEVSIGGDIYDKEKFDNNPVYAKHFANTNIMTFIISHKDSNEGNLLTSLNKDNPRVFTVDNGVTFSSPESDKGTIWKYLHVDRLPEKTINRLKNITLDDLNKQLGVVTQLSVTGNSVDVVKPTENLNPRKGVRQKGNIIQIGLTKSEIKTVNKKIQYIVKRAKKNKYDLF